MLHGKERQSARTLGVLEPTWSANAIHPSRPSIPIREYIQTLAPTFPDI